MRTPVRSPKPSNSDWSQASSTFQERLPTKRLAEAPPAGSSVLDFLGVEVSSSSSALRFLESLADSSLSDSESEESEPDSESDESSEPEED